MKVDRKLLLPPTDSLFNQFMHRQKYKVYSFVKIEICTSDTSGTEAFHCGITSKYIQPQHVRCMCNKCMAIYLPYFILWLRGSRLRLSYVIKHFESITYGRPYLTESLGFLYCNRNVRLASV